MDDLFGRFPALVGAAGLIVLGSVAAAVGGAAPVPQRVEVTVAAVVIELYLAFGAATERVWAVGLALIDAGALVVAFRLHHTTDKLLLGVPAIAALALAIIHIITMDTGPEAQPPPESATEVT
ncbi:MAG: hypothetical protein ABR579_05200 [Actinomycetota bacterium]